MIPAFASKGLTAFLPLVLLLQAIPAVSSSPRTEQYVLSKELPAETKSHRPLVLWHGLGDTSDSPGMHEIATDLSRMYERQVFSVKVPVDMDGQAIKVGVEEERKAGWYGNATSQVDDVAVWLQSISELADGGGIFLRDYVQRHNHPKVGKLITFGSPHLGIASLIPCTSSFDLWCNLAKAAAKRGIYTQWAQDNLIQASYYRDHNRLDEFHEINVYLTRLNGELEIQPDARKHLSALENLVLVQFDKDTTVYPKESSHFGSLTPASEDPSSPLITLEDNAFLWRNDSIGLRALGNGLIREHCKGLHMDLEWADERGCAKGVLGRYL